MSKSVIGCIFSVNMVVHDILWHDDKNSVQMREVFKAGNEYDEVRVLWTQRNNRVSLWLARLTILLRAITRQRSPNYQTTQTTLIKQRWCTVTPSKHAISFWALVMPSLELASFYVENMVRTLRIFQKYLLICWVLVAVGRVLGVHMCLRNERLAFLFKWIACQKYCRFRRWSKEAFTPIDRQRHRRNEAEH